LDAGLHLNKIYKKEKKWIKLNLKKPEKSWDYPRKVLALFSIQTFAQFKDGSLETN
jgi:hypothetical protein